MNEHSVRFLHRGTYRDLLRRHDGTPSDHPLPDHPLSDHPLPGTEDETRREAPPGHD